MAIVMARRCETECESVSITILTKMKITEGFGDVPCDTKAGRQPSLTVKQQLSGSLFACHYVSYARNLVYLDYLSVRISN